MTYAEYANKSNSNARIIVEIDLSKLNIQWINIGAGIWEVNFSNSYPYVDSSLLDTFSAQVFSDVGSVIVDGDFLQKVTSLLLVAETEESFYYDSSNKSLYIRIVNSDEPFLHTILIGNIYGFSDYEFTPIGALRRYEGRILDFPSISKSRDPLFFGKLSFSESSVTINNADGALDLIADGANAYGNEARVKFGYEELAYADYITLYTGYIGNINISETDATISFSDKRRQLTKKIAYVATAQSALDCIKEILVDNYNITYTDTYFDTTTWDAAALLAPDITVNMQEESPDSIINIIEAICTSCFGFFDVLADGRYSFHFIDTSASSVTTIKAIDILNNHEITYDTSRVLSSIRVSYAVNFDPDAPEDRTWLINTDYESDVYFNYKTYNEKDFDSWLPDATAATALSETIMDYVKDVHATLSVEVPMKYYELKVGDMVDVEINRGLTQTMLGTKKAEIISIAYSLQTPKMIIGLNVI